MYLPVSQWRQLKRISWLERKVQNQEEFENGGKREWQAVDDGDDGTEGEPGAEVSCGGVAME